MSKQDQNDGAATNPPDLEAELAREREAKAHMRERLRNTEALAAESHALRERMAQELKKVTAERDRLRVQSAEGASGNAAADGALAAQAAVPMNHRTDPAGSAAGVRAAAEPRPAAGAAPREPGIGTAAAARADAVPPRAGEWSTRPPKSPAWRGPWKALGLLAGVAACAAALAWYTGTLPQGWAGPSLAAADRDAPLATTPAAPSAAASVSPAGAHADAVSASATEALDRAASALAASRRELQSGPAVALAPASSPEALIAAAPTAAGPLAVASAPTVAPPELAARLRRALDAEGIAAPLEIDAQGGRVAVSDPAADNATRDRTDMLVRAVYAGASLPEPQIEHRWLSAPRAGRAASATAIAPAVPSPQARAAAGAKHAASTPTAQGEHRRRAVDAPAAVVAAKDEEPHVILPMGRLTAACRESTGGATSARPRGAAMNACMRRTCCSSGNRQSEECRAYEHAYPFTCSAG